MLIAAVNSSMISFRMDGVFNKDVVRGWHILSFVFVLAALHLMFNANPMHTSKSLKAKEDEKAKKNK